jgi:excinuclease ABC subunit A
MLKMKFRMRARTFKREELESWIPLPTANEMDDIPIYGNQPRVRLSNQPGGWQEVEIRAHHWDEINVDGFWRFLDGAIDSFQQRGHRVEANLDDLTPWAKLGEKWHYLRKGFPPGRNVEWDVEVLRELHELLKATAPAGNFLWTNKQVVHLFVREQKEPWASIQTKKADGVWLQLSGPKDSVSLGRVAEFANEPSVSKFNASRDIVRMKFKTAKQVHRPELKNFLAEHLASLPD